MPRYDYLIVGAGLFGSTFAYQAHQKGKSVLVIDQRNHIGGHCYSEKKNNIEIHRYGPHIFHTSNPEVWEFINNFTSFNSFINQPIAMVDGIPYNLPFNMNMFAKLFGVTKPAEVIAIIDRERVGYENIIPVNLEEQAIKSVGKTIYEKFVKGYTEKQWQKKCIDLPPENFRRLPVRLTYDNNYFYDTHQGIPTNGYTKIFEMMLEGIEIKLNTSYKDIKEKVEVNTIIYTGMIDEYYEYCFGALEYRALKFIDIEKDTDNYQGCAVINYPSLDIPYTRSIEHRHFDKNVQSGSTIISYEFSLPYYHNTDLEPSYPIGNKDNHQLYEKYKERSKSDPNIYFCGRLGSYKYLDMDDVIEGSLELAKQIL